MNGPAFSRREFVGLAAAGVAAGAVSSGCTMTGDRGQLVVAGSAPLLSPDRGDEAFLAAIAGHRAAGVDLAVVPIAQEPADPSIALASLLRLQRHRTQHRDEIRILSGPEDLDSGDGRDKLRILPQVRGMGALPAEGPEEILALVDGLNGLGVSMVRPTHQWRNRLADGCYERTDLGLTKTGQLAIRRLNEARILIDLSGMGRRSSLEALGLGDRPVVFANSNAASVHPHPANLTDEQIDTCARGGGVIAISAFPALVSSSATPTVAEVLGHVDYVAKRVGVQHVAMGFDFDDRERKRFPTDPVPAPPYRYPAGLESVADLAGFRSALAARGYNSSEAAQILGGNFVRVLRAAWERRET